MKKMFIVTIMMNSSFFVFGMHFYEKIEHAIESFEEKIKEDADIVDKLWHAHSKDFSLFENGYEEEVAAVKYERCISDEEYRFFCKRQRRVKHACEKMFGHDLHENQVPVIAIVGSGGGMRAMQNTASSVCAAKKIGLLNMVTYITALSGSTWFLGPWMSMWLSKGHSLSEFKSYLSECISKPFLQVSHEEKVLMLEALAARKHADKYFTLAQPYGALLANRLLVGVDRSRHALHVSSQRYAVQDGRLPLPIYTAIDGREECEEDPHWYEFTPYDATNISQGTAIPMWSWGSSFKDGTSCDKNSEETLGDVMAMCGSAFAADVRTIYKELAHSLGHSSHEVEKILKPVELKRPLPFWAKVSNYMAGLEHGNHKSKKLVDAGLSFNLPLPPVLGANGRYADIIIILDSSAGEVGGELRKAEEYAKQHNLLFPMINYTDIDKKTVSIFTDESNVSVPVIVYMPSISDAGLWDQFKDTPTFRHYKLDGFDMHKETQEGFCQTQHFSYTPEHSRLVMNNAAFNMRANKEIVLGVVRDWIQKRRA